MSHSEFTPTELREHTTFCKNSDGTVTAIFAHPNGASAMKTGRTEEQALRFVQLQLRGAGDKHVIGEDRRPWLTLCRQCNQGSAEAEERGEKTFAYCVPCAKAVDEWEAAFAAWTERMKKRRSFSTPKQLRTMKRMFRRTRRKRKGSR